MGVLTHPVALRCSAHINITEIQTCFAVSISQPAILPGLALSVRVGMFQVQAWKLAEWCLQQERKPQRQQWWTTWELGVWCMRVILVLRRLRQEDCCKLKASLGYITSVWPARTTEQDYKLEPPPRNQNKTKPSMDHGGSQEVLLTPSWTAAGNWWLWKREHLFLGGTRSLRGYLHSGRRLYTHVHTGSTKWTQWVSQKRGTLEPEREKWWGRRWGRWGNEE